MQTGPQKVFEQSIGPIFQSPEILGEKIRVNEWFGEDIQN